MLAAPSVARRQTERGHVVRRILAALKRHDTPATPGPARASGSRFRPRLLTLVVFFVAAAVIALANLSYDVTEPGNGGLPYRSYGWPLVWHRIALTGPIWPSPRAIGWCYSLARLGADLALWLLLLRTLAGTCEWLLRRYRPRPRWSLRTLLAFIALVAVLCGWYTHARNRAAIQDPLIPLRGGYGVPLVGVDRWGPKWLDLLGMDRLRRRIVVGANWSLDAHDPAAEQHFLQLVRAPDLRHLIRFHVDELTPTTAKALGSVRQLQTLEIYLDRLNSNLPAALRELPELRSLSVSWGYFGGRPEAADDNDIRLVDECLAVIGNMTRLETLYVTNLPVHGEGLTCLAGLKRLRSLSLDGLLSSGEQLLFTPASLATFGSLESLEEVRLGHGIESPEVIEALGAIRCLKKLHLSDIRFGPDVVDAGETTIEGGEEPDADHLDGFSRAFRALRQSKPGLVIDTEEMPNIWKYADSGLAVSDVLPERPAAWLPGGDLVWLTPQELADFEQAGGRASFEEATPADYQNKGTGRGIF